MEASCVDKLTHNQIEPPLAQPQTMDHDQTGLVLSLGCGGQPTTGCRRRRDPVEPSLTLSLSDDAYGPATPKSEAATTTTMAGEPSRPARMSSPLSAVSSFSTAAVKRENDVLVEEGEEERGGGVCSRTSDEDEDGNARKKLRLTKEQSALLEDRFKEQSTLNPKQKQALAKQLNLRPRTKLKQTEVDCEFLKRCCGTLTDENRRLQKEVNELRAMKFAPPLYMQLPAMALTMCPSCERVAGVGDGQKGGGGGAGPFAVSTAPKPHFFNPFTHQQHVN